MTISEFRQLGEDDRYIAWLNRAVQISDRETAQHYYALYQLDGFYIEMKFYKFSDKVPCMRTFLEEKRLNPYLTRISIDQLI